MNSKLFHSLFSYLFFQIFKNSVKPEFFWCVEKTQNFNGQREREREREVKTLMRNDGFILASTFVRYRTWKESSRESRIGI